MVWHRHSLYNINGQGLTPCGSATAPRSIAARQLRWVKQYFHAMMDQGEAQGLQWCLLLVGARRCCRGEPLASGAKASGGGTGAGRSETEEPEESRRDRYWRSRAYLRQATMSKMWVSSKGKEVTVGNGREPAAR